MTVQAIENGKLGAEIIEQRTVSDGIMREIEVGVVMNLTSAKALIDWLSERVKIVEEYQASAKAQESETKR